MILIYIISLFIAPQDWLEPFLGIRVDLFIYPIWIMYIAIKGKLNKLLEFNAQDYFFLLMILWMFLSTYINIRHHNTMPVLFNYVKWFLLYRLVVATIENDEELISVIHKVIFVVIIVAVQAIQQKYFSDDGIGWAGQSLGWVDITVLESGGTGRTRWTSIFDGPGVFCVMFTLVLPFLLFGLDKHFSTSHRIISIILIVPVLLAIWTTGSRGGFLSTVIIFAVFLLQKTNISLLNIVKVMSIVLIIYSLAPVHLTSIKDKQRSAQHRIDMWSHGLDMTHENPVFGIGKGNFARYTRTLIAHNSAIEIMGETGFVGLFLWVSLLYMAFKTVYQYSKVESNQISVSYYKALSVCLIGYLANSMFVTLEYETLYFVLALIRSIHKPNDNNASVDIGYKSIDLFRVLLILLSLYIMIKVTVMTYY